MKIRKKEETRPSNSAKLLFNCGEYLSTEEKRQKAKQLEQKNLHFSEEKKNREGPKYLEKENSWCHDRQQDEWYSPYCRSLNIDQWASSKVNKFKAEFYNT